MLEKISTLTPQIHSKTRIKGYPDNLNTSSNVTLRNHLENKKLASSLKLLATNGTHGPMCFIPHLDFT